MKLNWLIPLKYLHGEKNRRKIIFCNTNSEKNLVKQAYEHTLGGKIKEVIEKILMKKEL